MATKSETKKDHNEPIAHFQEGKNKPSKKEGAESSSGGITIIGEEKTGKNPTRLFQTGPTTREWLTQEEAENPPMDDETGNPTRPKFYWKPDGPVTQEKKS